MMNSRYTILIVVCPLLIQLFACSPKREMPTGPAQKQVPFATRSMQADHLWISAQETLRRHFYMLDRVDRRGGVITTMPTSSQHFFEFWRHDTASRADFWEATLNPMRRWVEVTLSQGDDESHSLISIKVHKQRLSVLDRQFNDSGSAYQFFGDDLPSTTGKPKVTSEDNTWIECGQDTGMEHYLLAKVMERCSDLTASLSNN